MIKSMPIKLVISFIAIVLLASIFYNPTSHAIGDIMEEGKGFLDASSGEDSVINQEALKNASNSIYNTLLAIAIIVAVIVAMILGIQFMYAAADEKAKIKEALMPFTVGCIVVFSSFTIWKVFINMGQSAEGSIVGISVEQPTDIDNNDESNDKKDDEGNDKKDDDDDFNRWYDSMKAQYFVNGEFDAYEGEEEAKNWSEEYWREFWNYMMKEYGTPEGLMGFDYHLKEYIKEYIKDN